MNRFKYYLLSLLLLASSPCHAYRAIMENIAATNNALYVQATSTPTYAVVGGSLTVQGNSFSVGSSTLSVSGGHVGIDALASSSASLTVNGTDSAVVFTSTAGTTYSEPNGNGISSPGDKVVLFSALGQDSRIGIGPGADTWFTSLNGSGANFKWYAGGSSGWSTMTFTSSGQLGVGIASPGAAVDVTGTVRASVSVNTEATSVTVTSCGSGASVVLAKNNIGEIMVGSGSTSCTLNFASSFASAPICCANTINGSVVGGNCASCASATTCTLTNLLASTYFTYTCF